MEDGLRTAVEASGDELMAELEDFGLDLRSGLVRTRPGSPRPRLYARVTACFESPEELEDPALRDAVIASELGWTAVFQDDCVDDVASKTRHTPPPRLVACTMSCDMGELCGEIPHLSGHLPTG
jgi:hypothetical protein